MNKEEITWVNSPKNIDGIEVVQENEAILEHLIHGDSVYHWERGESMEPVLHDKEYCLIKPIPKDYEIKQGDAVFCNVNGYLMTHIVWMVSNTAKTPYYLIGSTSGSLYGWTNQVFGIAYGTRILENVKDDE